jgi:DNA relaxase NicK
MSPQGIELAYAIPNEATGLSRYRLSIPGKPLCHIPTKQLDDFGKWLVNSGCRCSRLDWAIDDYSHGLRLEDIEEAVREGSYSGARVCRIYEKRVRGGTQIGKTIYLGSSESDRQVRIYDKAVESKGLIDAIRYEVQWRDELAHKCFMALFSSDSFEDGSKLVSQYAVGSVHFLSRVDKNLPRCPVKPWWQEFIDKVGERLKLSVPRVQPMLSDKKRWIERQVAATIAVIVRCMGFDDAFHWLEREVREKLAHQSGRADSFVRTWHDRQEVERLGFEDAWVMDSWNVA